MKQRKHATGHTKIYERNPEGRNPQKTRVPHAARGNHKPEKLLWMSAEGWIMSAPIVGSEWNENHEASYMLSHYRLHRPNDEMKLPNFLRPPKIHRRKRSKVRSELEVGELTLLPVALGA